MIYQLKAIRKNSKPPIWRRVLVSSDMTFAQLALILNTVLGRKVDDRYEFQSFMRKERVIELDKNSEIRSDFYYTYLEATTTYINDWLMDKSNFTLYSRDEDGDISYRIEIGKVFDKVHSPDYDNEEIYYPYVVKQAAPKDDDLWTDFFGISERLKEQYFYTSCNAPEDLTTSELKKRIEEGKGIALCTPPPKRDTAIKKSGRDTLRDLFGPEMRNLFNIEKVDDKNVIYYDQVMLRGLYEELSIDELSKMSLECGHELKASTHAAAVKELEEYMLSPDTMKHVLLHFYEEALDEFEKYMGAGFFDPDDKTYDKLEFFCYLGYVAEFNSGAMCIPRDVEVVYTSLKKEGCREFHRKATWLLDCLAAFDLLYAVESKQTLFKLYLKKEGMKEDYEEFLSLLDQIPDYLMPSVAMGERMISKLFLKNKGYTFLDKQRQYYDAYIPAYAEIMDYATHHYPASAPSYQRLHDFFKSRLHLSEKKNEELCSSIYYFIASGCNPSDIFNLLEDYGVVISSEKDMNRFMPVLIDVNNSTRMFDFSGHTPEEMYALHPMQPDILFPAENPANHTTIISSQPKVGRNDPCPCGSGKKYKKCCGRYS